MVDIFFNRDRMWFGTEERMGWIETPQTGAEVSPVGFGASATNLNGGGYVRNSWDSHKVHQFSWGEGASLPLASMLHAYRNGTYGRGLIYFHDPMYYGANILPRRWADPSMALNYEATPLIPDVWPRSTPTGDNSNDLPVNTTIYDVEGGYNSQTNASELFIPIPPGFTLLLGAIYTTGDPNAVLYARTPAGSAPITMTDRNASDIMPQIVSGHPWVRIGFRNATNFQQTFSIVAMSARLVPPGEPADPLGPWRSGEGHSGCRFEGSPTLINYDGVDGGHVGLACTLTETGAWE